MDRTQQHAIDSNWAQRAKEAMLETKFILFQTSNPKTNRLKQNTEVGYVVSTGKISIICNYCSFVKTNEAQKSEATFDVTAPPSGCCCVIMTVSVSNKTRQNHCGSCANLISLIADMRLSRTESAKQRGSERSVRRRKPDNEFKKEITRSKRGMHTQGAGELRDYHSEA